MCVYARACVFVCLRADSRVNMMGEVDVLLVNICLWKQILYLTGLSHTLPLYRMFSPTSVAWTKIGFCGYKRER